MPDNPLDAWDALEGADQVFTDSLLTLHDDPVDETRAQDMLGRLKARRLLDGFRGTPASNEATVASAIVRLSALAADVGELISGLDINPLIAGPSGCVAVDVLVAHEHPG